MNPEKAYGIAQYGVIIFDSIHCLKRDALFWAQTRIKLYHSAKDAKNIVYFPTKILKKYGYELMTLEINMTPWKYGNR